MNEHRFKYLLERYVSQMATKEEEEELKLLIQTGYYQDLFKEDLTRYMEGLLGETKDLSAPFSADQLATTIADQTEYPTQQTTRWRTWLPRIAASLVLAVGLGWWFYYSPNHAQNEEQPVKSVDTNEAFIRISRKDFIRLPDGSTVLLNDGSQLTYPVAFQQEGKREVYLEGEAFFDVAPDSTKSFVVHTGKISTHVLGTAFNIKARGETIAVTVARGLVEVADETKPLSLVHPAEQLTVNTSDNIFLKTEISLAEEIKWKEESLVFDNVTLKQAVEVLSEYFDTQVRIDNPAIADCRFSAWFLNKEPLDEILEMISGTRQAHYAKSNGVITISGGIACN